MRRREVLRTLLGLLGSALQAPALAQSARAASQADAEPSFSYDSLPALPRKESACWLFVKRSYDAFNAAEWQIRLLLPPGENSPHFERPNSAEFVVRFPLGALLTLHSSKGSHADPSDFEPREIVLASGKPVLFESFGGRSSDGTLPYFNLTTKSGGLIVAIGWTGDWRASFEAVGQGGVRVIAGLKRARFKLRQGEQLRLPSVMLMSYRGDRLDGQNQFRRLMLREFSPTNHPSMRLMPVAASVHGMLAFNDTNEQNLTALTADIAAARLPIDTLWLDAGWNEGGFPGGQGNPDADRARFPHGLAPLRDAVRKTALRFLAWFEPERAMRGTWLDRIHSDWLLRPSNTPAELRYQENDGFRLLDFGNPEARRWALESISRHIQEAGISVYRQDCNLYPAYFWASGERDEETGLREIRYVSGLYDFIDELARRHPDLIIDNCASGGRRLDFEMMRRCVCLWRSDNCWDDHSAYPRNVQAMMCGLSLWLPLHGLGAASAEIVALRSGMGACGSFAINFRDPAAVEALRSHLASYLKVRALFTADFYPLTSWSLGADSWLAFQFHEPATGQGIVQAFCRTKGDAPNASFKLRGLLRASRYKVTNWDMPGKIASFTGVDLMERGLVPFPARGAQALVFQYSADL